MLNLKTKWLFTRHVVLGGIAVGCLLAFGCLGPDREVHAFMQSLSKIDNTVRRDGIADTQQYSKVDEAISSHMATIQSPPKLKEVFYACEKASRRYVYFQAQTQVLFKLASMRNDSSARVLAGLLADERLAWDGESALNIYEALVKCGEPCIPYLSGFSGTNAHLAQKALAAIQSSSSHVGHENMSAAAKGKSAAKNHRDVVGDLQRIA